MSPGPSGSPGTVLVIESGMIRYITMSVWKMYLFSTDASPRFQDRSKSLLKALTIIVVYLIDFSKWFLSMSLNMCRTVHNHQRNQLSQVSRLQAELPS